MTLGNPWPNSTPKTVIAEDGGTFTITVYEYGITYQDEGGVNQLAHVEEDPHDPDRLKIAGRWFRAEPG